jgi:CHAT domain
MSSTRELMEDFYHRRAAVLGRAAALREAQLTMKDKYADPFYCGAINCLGEPSLPDSAGSELDRPVVATNSQASQK